MTDQRRLTQLLISNARRHFAARAGQASHRNDDADEAGEDGDGDDAEGVPFEIIGNRCAIYAFGVVDAWWGISAEEMAEALVGAGGREVDLYINSPGGDAIEARAICAALVAHPAAVHCHIVGMCASAATQLALAGNTCDMLQGSLYMIHEAWTLGWGNKRELGKTVALLGKIDGDIAADYARRTGQSVTDVLALMEAETWYTAEEAKAAGLVDAVTSNTRRPPADDGATNSAGAGKFANLLGGPKASASRWDLSAYRNAPKLAPEPARGPDEATRTAIAAQRARNLNRLRLLESSEV